MVNTLEDRVDAHDKDIANIKRDLIDLKSDLKTGLATVATSNEFLRDQNNKILSAIIERNTNATRDEAEQAKEKIREKREKAKADREREQRNFEIQKINKTNRYKMFAMIFGASGLATIVLDIILKMVK